MKKIQIPVIAIFAMLIVGCVRPPKQPRLDPFAASQIHVDGEELRRDTAVGVPIITRDNAGDLVHVTVPVRSAVNRTLYVDYWITFFDREGQPISKFFGGTKTLQANTPDTITVNSVSPRATDFQLDLRFAR